VSWLSALLNLKFVIDTLSNVTRDVKVDYEGDDYLYIKSSAFEVTVFFKDKKLGKFVVDLARSIASQASSEASREMK